ncbi:sulfotransferase family protein [Tabrizicola soli]|uniref:Sulfotransferase family protein n=1 Tax=Tabrizicola soli TaxID=2185115 RepID=A0ABV7DYU6_9RHOB|nr:sulfotransferase [Tabrizicola soli]
MPKVSFLVVGAQKSGTTTLHHHLAQQPDLYLPGCKEVHFFDGDSRDWSSPDYRAYEAFLTAAASTQICGEATPAYMVHRRFLERIRAYNPQMRLIAVLRHPVERAWSNWRMLVTQGAETLPFAQAIRDRRNRIAKNWRAYSYVERGFYADQIANILDLFPAGNCHFLLTEDLARDPTAAIGGTCALLDCPSPRLPVQPKVVKLLESRNLGPLSPNEFGLNKAVRRP